MGFLRCFASRGVCGFLRSVPHRMQGTRNRAHSSSATDKLPAPGPVLVLVLAPAHLAPIQAGTSKPVPPRSFTGTAGYR